MAERASYISNAKTGIELFRWFEDIWNVQRLRRHRVPATPSMPNVCAGHPQYFIVSF
jgi:hypothetical protein